MFCICYLEERIKKGEEEEKKENKNEKELVWPRSLISSFRCQQQQQRQQKIANYISTRVLGKEVACMVKYTFEISVNLYFEHIAINYQITCVQM